MHGWRITHGLILIKQFNDIVGASRSTIAVSATTSATPHDALTLSALKSLFAMIAT